MLKKNYKKIKRFVIAVVMSVVMTVALIPTVTTEVHADSFLSLNTEYDIVGLTQNEAIARIAASQVGLTGAELGAVEGWCADFVFSCAAAAGISSDIVPYTGDPFLMFAYLLDSGASIVTDGYRAGDLAFYPWMGENGHVGIFTDENTIVHGNTNGEDFLVSGVVAASVYEFADFIVVRPNYLNTDTAVDGYLAMSPYLDYPDTFFWDMYMPSEEEQQTEDQVQWQFEDGVLTILGPENVGPDSSGLAPWEDIKSEIRSVRICDTVKSIEAGTFYGLTELTDVTFMSALESIGDYAFGGCSKLTEINYVGTEEDFLKLYIPDSNWELMQCQVMYHTLALRAVKENKVASTCSVQGSHDNVWKCSDCGAVLFSIKEYDPLADHDWVSSKTVYWPTYTTTGLAHVYCGKCSAVLEVVIPSKRLKNISADVEGLMDYSLDGTGWYYVKAGRVATDVTTIAENSYGRWYVENGRVNFEKTGLVYYGDGWVYVEGGKVVYDHTGLASNEYGTWYMVNGNIDFTYTGVVESSDGLWLVKDGRVADGYNGVIIHNCEVCWVTAGKITE